MLRDGSLLLSMVLFFVELRMALSPGHLYPSRWVCSVHDVVTYAYA